MKINTQQLFQVIESNNDKYIDFLCKICSFEARAYDKETIDKMLDYITAFASNEGFTVERKSMEKCGDFLIVDVNKGKENLVCLWRILTRYTKKVLLVKFPLNMTAKEYTDLAL